ncbi:MAG TPA: alcohol dehydrogenase catalytic domain-containing protein [Sphingobium sp.]|uniref:zinc-dependent alcohol dehydrogenase n=1 Tax=Sphingobium sp. TaxID=1912891 RepID=UPI002ED3B2CE
MKAAFFRAPGQPIVIREVDMPEAGPNEVLVKVRRCGICGSDVSMTGDVPFTFSPGPIGHEYSGEIVEIGSAVTGLKVGQRIACLPTTPCGTCEGCRFGNPIFCLAPQGLEKGQRYGGFGEYVAMPVGGAKPIPDWLSYSDGALVEPMACGLHAIAMAGMAPGTKVLVLGAGSMAMSVVYWARRLGAGRIVVASRSTRRRDLAYAMNADAFHSFSDDETAALSSKLGGAPDLVAECVGKNGMLGLALEHVRPQGTIISLGMCQHAEPVLPAACSFKEVRMFFPVGYTVDEFVATARAFEADLIHPDMMVSDTISLGALPNTLEELRRGSREGAKIHVDPFADGEEASGTIHDVEQRRATKRSLQSM